MTANFDEKEREAVADMMYRALEAQRNTGSVLMHQLEDQKVLLILQTADGRKITIPGKHW